MCAMRVIQSFEASQTPAEFMEGMTNKLESIDSNTGSDQTYSYNIKNAVEEIKDLLTKEQS